MDAQFLQIISSQDKRAAARLLRCALGAAAGSYRLAVAARSRLYDSGALRAHRVTVPVISIGNITLGGTGKTPFVEFVCRWFLDRGKRPVILSRGYRSAGGHSDEALLLRANLPDVPHLQGKDRVALARRAIEELRPDVLVLDDGFQHRRLARDLDIVLVDCTEPFGYQRLFPRGLLREPIDSLRRAGLIVLSRADQCSPENRRWIREQILATAGEKPTIEVEHRPKELRSLGLDPQSPEIPLTPLEDSLRARFGRGADGAATETRPVSDLQGRSVAAFCGIGNPQAFWQTLAGLGCELIGTRSFRDHHRYSAADLAELAAWTSQLRPDFVITTQKDMVKIPVTGWRGVPLLALQIEAAVRDPAGELDRALSRVLATHLPLGQVA